MKETFRNIWIFILIGIFALNSIGSPRTQTLCGDIWKIDNSSNEKGASSLLFQLFFIALEEGFDEKNDNEKTIDFDNNSSLLNSGISSFLQSIHLLNSKYAPHSIGCQFLHLFLLYCCFKIALPG